jgi:hypothetical protein
MGCDAEDFAEELKDFAARLRDGATLMGHPDALLRFESLTGMFATTGVLSASDIEAIRTAPRLPHKWCDPKGPVFAVKVPTLGEQIAALERARVMPSFPSGDEIARVNRVALLELIVGAS